MSFCSWLIAFNILSPMFIHAVACVSISFLLRPNNTTDVHTTVCSATLPLMDIWVGCFYFFAIGNDAAMHTGGGGEIEPQTTASNAFGYRVGSGSAGSHGRSVFNFLRNLHPVFHSSCSILQSQQSTNFPICLHPHQHLFYVCMYVFKIAVILMTLMDMRWYLTVVLSGISLKISDLEHLFICLLAI